MITRRGIAFEKHEPALTAEDVSVARDVGRNALSFKAVPVSLAVGQTGFIAIKFALADGTVPIILLDETSARALSKILQEVADDDWGRSVKL